MIKSNYHVHSTYCDGKNTLEENVKEAIKLGFTSLGFSSHTQPPFSNYSMSHSMRDEYIKEIYNLKKKYEDKIEIYAGIEKDLFTDDMFGYDYIIGSVHFSHPVYECVIDGGKEKMIKNVTENFDGDYLKYAKHYFDLTTYLPLKTKCDIIGHFDIVSIYNDDNFYFDENSKEYLSYALDAAEYLIKKHDMIFELNSGAVFRGYKKSIYPNVNILKGIYEFGGRIMLNTDSHQIRSLSFMQNEMASLAKEVGFKTAIEMQGGEFVDVEL